MKIGFLFPGQGAQYVGMGKDLYEEYEEVRNIYEKVKEITGIDIAKISFEGSEDILNQTKYTQLAILTESLAITEVLKKENIVGEISCGLSLGEYSALMYSEALSFEEGIKLVQKRGEYMQELLPEGKWKMAAVIGMDKEKIEEACKKVTKGFVVPANYNSAEQIVVSGEEDAVVEFETIAKEMYAKKVMILNTAGPFHTKKLIDASNALRNEMDKITINEFKTKVVKNIDGKIYTNSDDIKDILAKHIINPVQFTITMKTLAEENVDTYIEIGPGKTLANLVKRANKDKEIKVYNINNLNTLKTTLENLKQ